MSDTTRNVVLTCVLLAASIAAGVMITLQDPGAGEQLMEVFRDAIVGEVLESPAPVLAATLFLNNLQACLIMFLGGVSFGVLTVLVIVSNGVVIGAIMEIVRQEQGMLYITAALAPHGIFEIPAFIISGTLGLLLAGAMWRDWRLQGDAASEAARMGRLFILFVIPLLLIAAFTEAFITPAVIALVA